MVISKIATKQTNQSDFRMEKFSTTSHTNAAIHIAIASKLYKSLISKCLAVWMQSTRFRIAILKTNKWGYIITAIWVQLSIRLISNEILLFIAPFHLFKPWIPLVQINRSMTNRTEVYNWNATTEMHFM